MGNLASKTQDCGCLQGLFLPRQAPDWYLKAVLGTTGSEAPEGSFLLLGFISLAVPELDAARLYYIEAMKMRPELRTEELRAAFGPSEIRAPVRENQAPQRWPGDIRVWVEDLRDTVDMFNMLGHTLGLDLVHEFTRSVDGGEYVVRIKCPFRTNWLIVCEAPRPLLPSLKLLAPLALPSHQPPQQKARRLNSLALSDATIVLSEKGMAEQAARFYEKILLGQVTQAPGRCVVHFAPAAGLHQTLTFKEDHASAPPLQNLGALCLYVKDSEQFRAVFDNCLHAGILTGLQRTWLQAERACEFHVRSCFDPQSSKDVVPMEHIVRHPGHSECPRQILVKS